ncbi:MAG: succinate--CoA ligase subunit alpha [Phycisphaerales bacterium]|nr:succinate--CoA ligase subunit alpha [Phycisphaerales bacterium]
MAILIDASTKVICQGITGAFGAAHTKGCLNYGTKLVGGVTPNKGGTKDANGLPIFDTVAQAVKATGATATMIFVPPGGAGDAIIEAAAAGIKLVCCITEGVPVQDMIKARAQLDAMNTASNPPAPSGGVARGSASAGGGGASGAADSSWNHVVLVGPNCPGVITPGPKTGGGASASDPYTNAGCKIGIMPGYIHTHVSQCKLGKSVGIVSRSGTLTYEAVWQTSALGLAQSTCVGIGGDPVRGINHIDTIRMFENDPDTHGILMIGEIGGSDEIEAAAYIKAHVKKPVAAFIGGATAPPGRRMGHAGAIIGGADDTAAAKIKALQLAGVEVAISPADMGRAMAKAMKIG